jgi:BioD-like phosphotransacetylase family protein
MITLYVTSASLKAGKTMLSAGLGKYWLESGKSVGYLKLISAAQPAPDQDKDAAFIKNVLNLPEPLGRLAVVVDEKNPALLETALAGLDDKDIVIVEGLPLQISAPSIAVLHARVLILHDYALDLMGVLPAYQKLADCLAGVVLNKVPRPKLSRVRELFSSALSKGHLTCFGAIPEDRILMSLSIGDLAEAVHGQILNNAEQSGELIENYMLGSSTFDRGAAYYNRKTNKAVILWGERPGYRKAVMANLQAAALQTSCRCLVINGGGDLVPAVKQKADEKKVPVIMAPGSLPDVVSALEKSQSGLKFSQVQKMPRLLEVLRSNLDAARLQRQLN